VYRKNLVAIAARFKNPPMKIFGLKLYAALLSLVLACACAGCSSFNRTWNAASAPSLSGSLPSRWQGHWISDVNGHRGRLRCIFTEMDGATCKARFAATYWKIFRAHYSVRFNGEWRDGVWHFNGTENLGALAGGVYHYEGSVSPTNFFSTYRCKYDHGTFELSPVHNNSPP
jgi:hypothetical protein